VVGSADPHMLALLVLSAVTAMILAQALKQRQAKRETAEGEKSPT
jgi:hypothetical protein